MPVLTAVVRAPAMLPKLGLPWLMVPGFAVLPPVVDRAHAAGWLDPVIRLAGEGSGLITRVSYAPQNVRARSKPSLARRRARAAPCPAAGRRR